MPSMLTQPTAKIFPAIREEVDNALSIELPLSKGKPARRITWWVSKLTEGTEWSEIDISTQILRVIARVSGRAFVGTGLHRNEEWIDISCNVSHQRP